jgi:dUTP pyrophosphatase
MSANVVKIEILDNKARIPTKAHDGDACYDIYSIDEYTLHPGSFHAFRTGLKMQVEPGYYIEIRPRSGLAINHGITVLNSPGTIDSNYGEEVKIILINHGKEPYTFLAGNRIAQMTIHKSVNIEFKESKIEGRAGFGSSGV